MGWKSQKERLKLNHVIDKAKGSNGHQDWTRPFSCLRWFAECQESCSFRNYLGLRLPGVASAGTTINCDSNCFNRFPGACTAQHSYDCHLLRVTSDEGWSLFLFLMRRSKAASSTQYLAQWGLKSARISETSEKVSQDPWWSKIGDGCAMECEYTTDERWHTTQKKPHRTVLAHVYSSCLF